MVSLLALEAESHVEPLAIRRYHKWISTGLKLNATPPGFSTLGAEWHRFRAGRRRFPGLPKAPSGRFPGHRQSPFHVMRGLIKDLQLGLSRSEQEPFPPRLMNPWELTKAHPDDTLTPCPRLGSASSRDSAQTARAKAFSNKTVSALVTEGFLVAATDGSATPLPDPYCMGGAAVVFTMDGANPLSTLTQ